MKFNAWVLVCMMIGSYTQASTVVVEPDDFALGSNLSSAYPGVTLSVEGKPGSIVRAVDGYTSFLGRNIASTGSLIFGQDPIHSASVPQGWDDLNGLLRIDFATPTDFVQIDVIFDDDDTGRVRAFSASGSLIEQITVLGDGRGTSSPYCPPYCEPTKKVSINRANADISYVLVGGEGGEALFLDNLQFNRMSILVPIDIKPGSVKNCFNQNGHGVIPVAVLGSADFDVSQIDTSTLFFGGLKVRVRGNSNPMCSLADVNQDAAWDLVCQFEDNSDLWAPGDGDATISGEMFDGTKIEGTDSICIVPRKSRGHRTAR
jgi:hypothetical protein